MYGVDWIGLHDMAGERGMPGGRVRGLIGLGCMIWHEHMVWQVAMCDG